MDDFIGLFILQLFILAVAAIIGAVCFFLVTALTRNIARGRWLARFTAFLFPVVAILYCEAGFLARDFVRYNQGSDNDISSSYHYPLVNGYRLSIFDDNPVGGYLEGPKGVYEAVDAVQVTGDFIFADQGKPSPSHAPLSNGSFIYRGSDDIPTVRLGHEGEDIADVFKRDFAENPPKQYLIVDTITSKVTHASLEELKRAATDQGVALKWITTEQALPIAVHAAAPGAIFLGLLFTPVLLTLVWLLFKLRQLVQSPQVRGSPTVKVRG